MNDFIKKHINIIIIIFILIQPLIDLLTGLCLHTFNLNLTIGIFIRIIFLVFIVIITLFTFKKKNILIPYLIIGLYSILYLIGIVIYKDTSYLFQEIQGLVKVFYFPILLISLYSIKDNIRISKMTLFTTLIIYLIAIFIPTILNVGYKTYEITKSGTLGFFNSANEISGIISLLTPIMFIIFTKKKTLLFKIIISIIYLGVILMMGTKTPLLSLGITIGFTFIYSLVKCLKQKKYKPLIYLTTFIVIGIFGLILIIPRTNFYKNIKTHLDYLKLDSITEVFKDEELIDHFIFSQRLTFLKNKQKLYEKSSLYQKIVGIGYLKNNKATKMIEMDYFDIYYSHGILGFIIFFGITLSVIINVFKEKQKLTFERYMLLVTFLLIIFLSFFTGHIITAPSVSLLVIILILQLAKRTKKDLLFTGVNLEVGGIENAQINLINNINYNKYNVTLILEEKKVHYFQE